MSKKESYSLAAHDERFGTEEKCRDFLLHVRWDDKPKCPECGNDNMNYYLTSRKVYKCKGCYKQFSITQGTIFERSKLPLTTWFRAIYFFTTMKRGVSSCQMAELLGIRQKNAWFLLQRLREALKDENNILLSGIVEADETFIGPDASRDTRLQKARKEHYAKQEALHGMGETKKIRYNKKHGIVPKKGRPKGSTKAFNEQKRKEMGKRVPFEKFIIILGMMEKGGKVVMKILGYSKGSITQENVFKHLKKHISSDSTLVTDEFGVYKKTTDLFPIHKTVNHDIAYVIKGVHINNIENAWKHLKKTIDGTYFHISRNHFERYLNENTYRWNRREKSRLILVEDFTSLLVGNKITYKKLVEKNKAKLAA